MVATDLTDHELVGSGTLASRRSISTGPRNQCPTTHRMYTWSTGPDVLSHRPLGSAVAGRAHSGQSYSFMRDMRTRWRTVVRYRPLPDLPATNRHNFREVVAVRPH